MTASGSPAAVQTIWADAIAATLADAGIATCVISPGSRSTPLVAALATAKRLELVTLIDERAAAFFALGVARATGRPAALVCTSGSAAAHYLPAIVEASMAGVPLVALTANRPPELHDCGASQTIDQHALYGGFVRGAFELGAPVASELAVRAVRRKLLQAITLALGPAPGPVHVDVALRKPLEPAGPSTDGERALARAVATLSRQVHGRVAPPVLAPDRDALGALARALTAEPRGLIVAGAMPVAFAGARDAVFELARRTGYPIVAEAGSQLRFGTRPSDVAVVDHFDLIPLDRAPAPHLVVQLGAEPVAAAWPAFAARGAQRWVLAGPTWRDPDSAATVILGDPALAVEQLVAALREPHVLGRSSDSRTSSSDIRTVRRDVERAAASLAWRDDWLAADDAAAAAVDLALRAHPGSETAALRAALHALPDGALVQLGNSLPIRVVEHAAHARACGVITQRGAAGIDGLVASAAGATRAGKPVLLVLGDVSFAHDLGGLLAARAATSPLVILVVDNGGGQIFAGLPVARAGLGEAMQHWLTPPAIDPVAIASAVGVRALVAASPAEVARAVAGALEPAGDARTSEPAAPVTLIHVPVTASGAHDVRRDALQLHATPALALLGGQS